MLLISFLSISLLTSTSVARPQATTTEDPFPTQENRTSVDWIPYNGNLYHLNLEPTNWFSALHWCFEQNANLASILSLEENIAVNDIVESKMGKWCRKPHKQRKCKSVWIGGLFNKTRERLEWTDKSEWTFSNTISPRPAHIKSIKEDRCLMFQSKLNFLLDAKQLEQFALPDSLAADWCKSRTVNPWHVASCKKEFPFVCKKSAR